MTKGELLECVERGPERATAAIIWLHGLGADGYDFEPVIPALGLPPELAVRFVFPHAPPRPVTLNGGLIMRAWYDIHALDLDQRSHDEKGIRESIGQVTALIDRERGRGVASEKIVLAGFSQGGAIAIQAALRYPDRLAGLVALSCYFLIPESAAREVAPANGNLPIFMAHGMFDPMIPAQAGQLACESLKAMGHDVDWRTYPVPHAVHPREIHDIGRYLVVRLS